MPGEAPQGAAATVRDVLARSKAPVTFKALAKQAGLRSEHLQQILPAEEGRDGIFRWPGARGQRFWSVDAAEFARRQILTAATECALPAVELVKQARKKAHAYPEKLVRSLVQQLIRDKELRKYPAFGRGSNLIGRVGHPAAYGEAARRFKEALDAKVRAEMAGEGSSAHSCEDSILEIMRRLEPSGSAPVSVRELRLALPSINKADFDAAALALRSSQKVFLSRHDYPQSLAPEERDLLVDGGDGSYYVAITVRIA